MIILKHESTMAIHIYSTQYENLWNKGQLAVMIKAQGAERPFGYCDGTQEDADALIAMAEGEGLERVRIERKDLKTGRQVWTILGDSAALG